MNTALPETKQNLDQLIREKTIHFPSGIPGFPEHTRFVFTQTAEEHPFAWMRSLDDVWLGFPVVEVFHLAPDYRFEANDAELMEIKLQSPSDCVVMAILRIEPRDRLRIHANLRAPLVINRAQLLGRQIILPPDFGYSESTKFEF